MAGSLTRFYLKAGEQSGPLCGSQHTHRMSERATGEKILVYQVSYLCLKTVNCGI